MLGFILMYLLGILAAILLTSLLKILLTSVGLFPKREISVLSKMPDISDSELQIGNWAAGNYGLISKMRIPA